jgi:hypothetical protein
VADETKKAPTRQTVELTVDEVEALKVDPKPPAVPKDKPPTDSTVEITVEDLHMPKPPPPPPKP